jgi:hypothetical protein
MHNEPSLTQALSEFGIRLTNGFKIMTTLAHRHHFFKDSVFLSAKTCGGL